ncbi:hypothetical protein GIB67_041157 [Kingdonia uniflora]|uniref:Light-regulated protein n=1 Tax=Kingdonia uniflora TaxID=39325 RepID=A0A7J7LKJ5_9MAGN|nr:hypothetical protein GIB67_041157 [Kingdonia uniflora]
MQAALCFVPSLPTLTPTKIVVTRLKSPLSSPTTVLSRRPSTRAAPVSSDNSTVDYSSVTSVFPAEACDTIGGEACNAEIFPEAKLKQEDGRNKAKTVQELVDREYVEYDELKTVFPGEACDDLGGEFCQPEYQAGVYKEVSA